MPSSFTPPADPWALFAVWMADAAHSEPSYPDAMTLATVGADGMPAQRVMLCKGYDERGVVFYTNRESRKGHELAPGAFASVNFYWKSTKRQIRVEGVIELVSDAESDAYFATRPRGSQIGAWASQQSRPLDSRETLESRVQALEAAYEGKPVPRPPHWGGYRLVPRAFEFWQEGQYRLHDRFTYTRARANEPWRIERINP